MPSDGLSHLRPKVNPALLRALLLVTPLAVVIGYAGWVLFPLATGSAEGPVAEYATVALVTLSLLTLGAAGVVALAHYWIHTQRTEPLNHLLHQVKGLGDGAPGDRVDVRASGDFAEVAEAINAMAARLEERHAALLDAQRLATVGTLVAGVAHEINNPLTYMKGTTDMVLHDLEDLSAAEEIPAVLRGRLIEGSAHLRVTLEGMDRLATIAATLKRVSRPSQGARGNEDVNTLVQNCLILAQPELKGKNTVHLELTAEQTAHCNASEISQVILNLVLNGVQAMPDGGRLTVRTVDATDRVVIEVIDSGPGIPPEAQGRLFTPFFTTKAHGTGLGLTISKGLVEAHGGRLTFSTTPGIGTSFRVELPTSPAPVAPRGQAPGAAAPLAEAI